MVTPTLGFKFLLTSAKRKTFTGGEKDGRKGLRRKRALAPTHHDNVQELHLAEGHTLHWDKEGEEYRGTQRGKGTQRERGREALLPSPRFCALLRLWSCLAVATAFRLEGLGARDVVVLLGS